MPKIVILLLIIPPALAFIGWVTNWVAVKMTFYPRDFIGRGWLGWQGIIPRNAAKFAGGAADNITDNLISTREMAERLDPVEMENLLSDTLDHEVPILCRDAAEMVQPAAWDALPKPVQDMVVVQVRTKTSELVHEVFDHLQGVSEEVLDLKHLIQTQLSGVNTDTQVKLFQDVGNKEFRFIEIYGGVFGFLIGLVQVVLWSIMQQWWLMPAVGLLVGLLTNYLAIQMIFRPLEPTRYLGLVTYQGMFPKRQAQIAHDYSRIIADDVLSVPNLVRLVTEGETGAHIAETVMDIVSRRLDEEWQKIAPMVPIEVSQETLDRLKADVVERVVAHIPAVRPDLEAYLERKLDIGNTLQDRLSKMDKPSFERVLRGVFEEDERTLILVGGVLGLLLGFGQAALVLAF